MSVLSLIQVFRFIVRHPLSKKQKVKAFLRFFAWQLGSRIVSGPVAVNFVDNTRLLVSRGMTGATGNIYAGLHEFEDMAFVLHVLRENDLFVDVGANVGSYTILAAGAVGANCISIEPVPSTYKRLMDNINLNVVYNKVTSHNIGIGRRAGQLSFSCDLDTVNHVVTNTEAGNLKNISVPIDTLDAIIGNGSPALIKIDVEGFESEVIAGAEKALSNPSLFGVLLEFNGSGGKYGFDEDSLHLQMLQYGFKPFSYSPFSRELCLMPSKCNSGNTLYLRNMEHVKVRLKTSRLFEVCDQLI